MGHHPADKKTLQKRNRYAKQTEKPGKHKCHQHRHLCLSSDKALRVAV